MHEPPHDPAGVDIRHQGEKDEPRERVHVSDITDPNLVGALDLQPFHQVWELPEPPAGIRRYHSPFLVLDHQVVSAKQAVKLVTPDLDTAGI